MKKLMFAIGLAGVCGAACADVTSANIVGYNQRTTANYMYVGTPFTGVGGGESFTWKDFKVNVDETGDIGDGWQALADSINMLNQNGSYVRTIIYLPQFLAEVYEVNKGWYDAMCTDTEDYTNPDDCYNDEVINFGEAFQVHADPGTARFDFAGEVKQAPTVTDCANYMGIANCACKTLKARDLIVNCDETGDGDGSGWQPLADSINMLNLNGSYVRTVIYLPQFLAEVYEVEKGWYDAMCTDTEDYTNPDDCYNDKLVWEAGEGFQIHADPGTATITVKSALAKDEVAE